VATRGTLAEPDQAGGARVLLSLRESGEALVRAGRTPPEEVQRVLGLDDDPAPTDALPRPRVAPPPRGP
jgi:hypothetical protein